MQFDAVSSEMAHMLLRECGDQPNEALFTACAQGMQEVAACLIQHLGADVNCKVNGSGKTPLHAAVHEGHLAMVRLLVKEFGADVAVASRNGSTALHAAAERGNVEAVRVLVAELGASMEARTAYGSTPLHDAIRRKHTDVVRTLAALGADTGAAEGSKGWTPLHIAADADCSEVALLLVNEFNANVNAKADDGRTPLHISAGLDSADISRLLVSMGADVEARASDGSTPLFVAVAMYRSPSLSNARFLIEEAGADVAATNDRDGRTPLHIAAAAWGNTDMVRMLVTESLAPVGAKDKCGNTPLHLAASAGGGSAAVEILLACHALAVDWNNEGRIPLHSAAFSGSMKIMRCLAGCGAVNADSKGRTPLHLAVLNDKNSAAIALVEEFSADMNAKDALGMTPLHLAASRGRDELFLSMVKKSGADIGAVSNHSHSVLHFAAYNGHSNMLRMLVEEVGFANVDSKDKWGRTPLHIAASRGHVEAVRVLVRDLGADVNEPDAGTHGWSPLRHAFEGHHYAVAHVLLKEFGADGASGCALGLTPDEVETFVTSGLCEGAGASFPTYEASLRRPPCDGDGVDGNLERIDCETEEELTCEGLAREERIHSAMSFAALRGKQALARLLVQKLGAKTNFVDLARLHPSALRHP